MRSRRRAATWAGTGSGTCGRSPRSRTARDQPAHRRQNEVASYQAPAGRLGPQGPPNRCARSMNGHIVAPFRRRPGLLSLTEPGTSTPRPGWGGAPLGIGVMRASGVPSGPVHADGLLPARAVFESAKIEETYSFEQEIYQNHQRGRKKEQTGRIELSLPCDGDKFFTRQAYSDVSRTFGHAHGSARILAGYLALEGHGHTDLDSRLDVSHTYGSIPIVFDIPRTAGSPQPDHLIADRSRYIFSCDYKPGTGHLKTIPVRVDIDLRDPDSVGWSVADRPAPAQTAAVPTEEAQPEEEAAEDAQSEEETGED